MSRIVIKFGGTSLMDTIKIKAPAQIVAAEAAAGNQVVTVVSAMGHTTDHLIELAGQVQEEPDRAELDSLLITGEQTAAALFSMALIAAGLKS